MFALARLRIVILGWAGASLFFTAVLEISELGRKRLGFALYSNAVQFALWVLTLPLLARCIQRFPLKAPTEFGTEESVLSSLRCSRRSSLLRTGPLFYRPISISFF